MCKREREGKVEESQGHPFSGLEEGGHISRDSLLALVGGRDTLMVFGGLYPPVFLSFSWALNLERERAFSGNGFFEEFLLSSKMKLRIQISGDRS